MPNKMTLNFKLVDEYTKPTSELSTAVDKLDFSKIFNWLNGNAANQSEAIFHDQRTIAASGNEDLDLAAGGLVDAFGNTLTFTDLKMVVVFAAVGNTNNVIVGGQGVNDVPIFSAVGDSVPVKPGGLFTFLDPTADGVAVTPGTGDLLRIANGGGGTSVTYDIILIGDIT